MLDEAIKWTCPWCGRVARRVRESICESRVCDCGALALGAFAIDYDEITDEAIGYFRVQIQESSRGYESLLRGDMVAAGVELRNGVTEERGNVFGGAWSYQYLWFRCQSAEDA